MGNMILVVPEVLLEPVFFVSIAMHPGVLDGRKRNAPSSCNISTAIVASWFERGRTKLLLVKMMICDMYVEWINMMMFYALPYHVSRAMIVIFRIGKGEGQM